MNHPHIQALFQAVHEAPVELARREVLADALLELGDPRGEFILLQLDGSNRARKRAAKLLQRHRQAFLGSLADTIVGGTDEWRSGFLVSAAARLVGERTGDSGWATVEKLVVVLGPQPPLELASPHLRSLREVRLTPLMRNLGSPPEPETWARQQRALEAVRLLLLEGSRPKVLTAGAEWIGDLRWLRN